MSALSQWIARTVKIWETYKAELKKDESARFYLETHASVFNPPNWKMIDLWFGWRFSGDFEQTSQVFVVNFDGEWGDATWMTYAGGEKFLEAEKDYKKRHSGAETGDVWHDMKRCINPCYRAKKDLVNLRPDHKGGTCLAVFTFYTCEIYGHTFECLPVLFPQGHSDKEKAILRKV